MKRLAALLVAVAAVSTGGGAARAGCSPNVEWQDAGPRFSPDGTKVAFYRVELGCDLAPRGIWLAFVADGRARRLANAARVAAPNPPSWSPDGRLLAYGAAPGVVVEDLEGTGTDQLTASRDDFAPAWSPDGRWIAFRRGVGGTLWLVRPDGTGLRRLDVPRLHETTLPAWSPDSAELAFAAYNGPSTDVHVVEVETGAVRVLAPSGFPESGPAWSPDGRTLAYASERGGRSQVFLVARDGSDARRAADGRDPSFAPDGRLAYETDRDVLGARAWTRSGISAHAAGGRCLRYGIYVGGRRLTNPCVFRAEGGRHTVRGTAFRDFLYGSAARDRLYGGGRRDVLEAGPGSDVLDGGGGWDTLRGGPGADLLLGGADPDVVLPGPRPRPRGAVARHDLRPGRLAGHDRLRNGLGDRHRLRRPLRRRCAQLRARAPGIDSALCRAQHRA